MRVKHTGYDVINRIKAVFGESVITDMEPKFLGKHLITVISQTSGKKTVKKDPETSSG